MDGDSGELEEERDVGRGGVGVIDFILLFGEGGVKERCEDVSTLVRVEGVDAEVAALLTKRGELLTDCAEGAGEEELVARGEGERLDGGSFAITASGCILEVEVSAEAPTHCRGAWREFREEVDNIRIFSGEMGLCSLEFGSVVESDCRRSGVGLLDH